MKQIRIKVSHLFAFQFILVLLSLLINNLLIKKNIYTLLFNGIEIYYQVIIGVSIGLIISGLIVLFLKMFNKQSSNLNHLEILYKSSFITILLSCLVTGLSEELFFRAIIQSSTGLTIASVFFAIAHSQFWLTSPVNAGKILFGIIILSMGFVFGVLYNMFGYIAAASSHFIFDFILLIGLKNIVKANKSREA